MAEELLIKQCQAGDKAAFESLLSRHYDTIYRIAYRWCGDQTNAQDITQLACIKLAKAIHHFRLESSFTSWLYPLVINCAKDFYKSPTQHNVREEQHDQLEAHAGSSSDSSAKRIYARQILEYIETLQEDLKETLVLVYASGLSHRQAADRLQVKESTISWRVHEARKILKQAFISSDISADGALSADQQSTAVRGLL